LLWPRGYPTDDNYDRIRRVSPSVKHLLRAAIRAYWALWPRRFRRGCLYRETCSRYVYRVTDEIGFVAGLRALSHRVRTCRPGYAVSTDKGEFGLALRDGSFLQRNLVAEDILASIQLEITRIEGCLANDPEAARLANRNDSRIH
jgi:putative component of membrane protein insertase Oxa1/YidC/SpoIIIJ protein YidD